MIHRAVAWADSSGRASRREALTADRGMLYLPDEPMAIVPSVSSRVDSPGDARHPTVSIVTVNYNGRRYLERFLESVLAIDYPRLRYGVVLVDNASTDGSAPLVRARFPGVRVVDAGGNLGFAGGCNLGIRAAASDYVALVNNDTVVEAGWLRELVDVAESDPHIGLVGSKLLFLTPFLDLGLEMLPDGVEPPGGAAALELLEARAIGCDYDKLIIRDGHIWKGHDGVRVIHTLARSARLAVPIAQADASATLVLTLRAVQPGRESTVAVFAGDTEIERLEVTHAPRTFRIDLPRATVVRAARDMINNAGTRIDGEGQFGDRGIFEFDHGQFDLVTDVPALCGASVLLRRTMLERIGGFDTRYFMYFEDVDLSWRARRAGWRLVYTPALAPSSRPCRLERRGLARLGLLRDPEPHVLADQARDRIGGHAPGGCVLQPHGGSGVLGHRPPLHPTRPINARGHSGLDRQAGGSEPGASPSRLAGESLLSSWGRCNGPLDDRDIDRIALKLTRRPPPGRELARRTARSKTAPPGAGPLPPAARGARDPRQAPGFAPPGRPAIGSDTH